MIKLKDYLKDSTPVNYKLCGMFYTNERFYIGEIIEEQELMGVRVLILDVPMEKGHETIVKAKVQVSQTIDFGKYYSHEQV